MVRSVSSQHAGEAKICPKPPVGSSTHHYWSIPNLIPSEYPFSSSFLCETLLTFESRLWAPCIVNSCIQLATRVKGTYLTSRQESTLRQIPSDETSVFKVNADIILGGQRVDTKQFPLFSTGRKAGDRVELLSDNWNTCVSVTSLKSLHIAMDSSHTNKLRYIRCSWLRLLSSTLLFVSVFQDDPPGKVHETDREDQGA